ncbi:MAG: dihydrodipicolinate synthase family protein [Prosthecobacter sp.]|nr:dihydrodipicolinate synthase family protein [Prosthecobacter sp.]
MTKRYRSCILATCCVPWREDWQFAEEIFRRQVRHQIASGIHDLYIFGTAGEGYAVTETQFDEITRVFLDETSRNPEVQAMVGLISLSLPTVIERIERAAALGARRFQISLPSWGALSEFEMAAFFRETCGRFPDFEFLHYNLLRSQRLITPAEYGRLALEHPNLVATKNSTSDVERLRGLITEAPDLQHFITEGGFADAALMGECGFLISIASTNFALGQRYFSAGQRQNEDLLRSIQQECTALVADLKALVGQDAHMDGAYDKMFCRIHDPDFPLRLQPPYSGVSETAFEAFVDLLRIHHPHFLPQA